MSLAPKKHIVVIDPGVIRAEVYAFNRISQQSSLPVTYHQPAMVGTESLGHEKPEEIAGLIILGSLASVHDRLAWQPQLENWLMPLLEKEIPTLGICYAHQMIAHLFGGKVTHHSEDKSNHKGLREVTLGANPLWGANRSHHFYVSHCEHVAEKPACMNVIAQSAIIPVEGLVHQKLPIWTFQFHPEKIPGTHGTENLPHENFKAGHELVDKFLAYAHALVVKK